MPYVDHFRMPSLEDNFLFDETANSRKDGGRISTRRTPRPLSRVTGLVLHQTAIPSQRAGNDPSRYRGVRTHYVITPDGSVVQNHAETVVCNASNRLNGWTVAVEFVGNFRSERGRWWNPSRAGSDHVTTDQIMSGRWLVIYCRDFFNITHVYGHKQSNGGKNCPGPDIWYHVGQWAVDVLGLSDGGPNYKIGKGAPIPAAWRTWNRPP